MIKCERCGHEPVGAADDRILFLMPAPVVECWMCMDCAVAAGMYCQAHDQMHTTFTGTLRPLLDVTDGHACLCCVDDVVRAGADISARYDAAIRAVLPPDEMEELDDWTESAGSFMGDTGRHITLLRAVAVAAARAGVTTDDVVAAVVTHRRITPLLPSYFIV